MTREAMLGHKLNVFVSRDDFPTEGIDILKTRSNVDIWPALERGDKIPKAEFLQRIVGKDALLICSYDCIDEEVLEAGGPTLKVISTISSGLDHIDLNAVKKSNVRLAYTPGVPTESVAEHTIALLLATSRRIVEANSTISKNQWEWTPTWMCGTGLEGSTVGIFGFGRLGQSVAKKLLAFNVSRILYNGPRKKIEAESFGAIFVSFHDLLRESDYIIVLCPLTPDTKGIFTRETFSLMKRTAIFINTARGDIVDQEALLFALENNLIRGAGLDVMTPEPLPPDHPLMKLENCVLTPHIAAAVIETRNRMCYLAVKNLLSVLDGQSIPQEYIL